MYYGVKCIKISPYVQNPSDYVFKSENDYLYIKYKDNEFLVKKETFRKSDLCYRDMNNKHVSSTKAFQIYRYVTVMHKDLLEREFDKSKAILKSEVVDKFSNVRIMTYEEKLNFIKEQKLKKIPRLKNINLVKRILSQDMYIVECKIFDKRSYQVEYSDAPIENVYTIKITDGNYIVDDWIRISKENYNKNVGDTVKFYVFDRTGSDYFVIF